VVIVEPVLGQPPRVSLGDTAKIQVFTEENAGVTAAATREHFCMTAYA